MINTNNLLGVILIITSTINVVFQIPNTAFAQQEFNNSGTTESVTSTYDAIIQVYFNYIAGVNFRNNIQSCLFSKNYKKRKTIRWSDEENDHNKRNNQLLKRFTAILALCCITIIIASTGTMLIPP